jgi:hypothetical protein
MMKTSNPISDYVSFSSTVKVTLDLISHLTKTLWNSSDFVRVFELSYLENIQSHMKCKSHYNVVLVLPLNSNRLTDQLPM